MPFIKGQPSANPNGRPKGSGNKKYAFPQEITDKAIQNVRELVEAGDYAASIEVLKRTHPVLKPVTAPSSIDAEFLQAKMYELTELQKAIKELQEARDEQK
ncbi:hypothetical protein BCT06_12715 [Vibrio breoganii]|uniref:hypothetical protein n=1 Tax=Vibrio breoganii TaxID=553239 RepID=UPI000C856F07|nr:hypothetical protein [Vibrio breoganii]PMO60352.1 hypothetical protein BCT06_12715 [Vibrio breoganii]